MEHKTNKEKVLIGRIQKLHKKLENVRHERPVEPDPNGYEDLAPSKNINIDIYEKAMDYALSNPNITNIAVTGNYGSGKSSVLRSYEYKRPEHRYLNLSLASFDDSVNAKKETRKLIEISILQQIFYRVKHSKIPDSRFKRIRKLSHTVQWLCSILALFWVASIGILFKIKTFENVVNAGSLPGYWPDIIRFIALFVFLGGTIAIVYYLVRPLRNTKFSKLNFVKGDIEIGELGKASILNEYLDEILYFFEVNDFDVVIIEDLDRFNDTAIFTRLRELNNLLNNSDQVGRRIVFIYAIKDEMFLNQTRSKFFEFIIPVIPVISSTNSVDRLFEKLDTLGLRQELTDSYIKAIMLYIDDMRMLKNIVNEYVLYRGILDDQLNKDHMFAMVVYKNVEPIDYANLNTNTGLVYQAFQNKQDHISATQESCTQKIHELEELIRLAQKEQLKTVAELRLVYLHHITKSVSSDGIRIGSITKSIYDLMSDENFELVKTSKVRHYVGYTWQDIDFAKYEKEVDPDQSYAQREQQVLSNRGKYIAGLQQQIAELRTEIRKVKAFTLAELTEAMGLDILGEDIRKKKLLTYLLHNGLIDEMYPDFISHFYIGSLTRQDRNFVLSVKNEESLPYDFPLTNVGEVAQRITLGEFSNPEVLNYSLLDYLLKYHYKFTDELQAMTARFQDDGNSSFEFLDGYFERGQHTNLYIKHLTKAWPGFFDFITEKAAVTEQKRYAYFDAIIRYTTLGNLPDLNRYKNLTNHLVNDPEFLLTYSDPKYHERIKSVISKLDIRFTNLNVSDQSEPLLDYIIQQGLFALTPGMVTLILTRHRPDKFTEAGWKEMIETRNYAAIQMSNVGTVLEKVNSDYDTYAEDVFLKMDHNVEATKEDILAFLANEKIGEENRALMFAKQEYVFDRLDEIPEEFRDAAIESFKVKANWTNVMAGFHQGEEISPALLSFLDKPENAEEIASALLSEEDEEPDDEKARKGAFVTALAQEALLSDDAYKKLLHAIDYVFPEIDLEGLSIEKIRFLIDHHKLPPNAENIGELKKFDPPLHFDLLEKEMEAFLTEHTEVVLTSTDYAMLLRFNNMDPSLKLRLLKRIDPVRIKESQAVQLAVGDLVLSVNQSFDTALMLLLLKHEIEPKRKVKLVMTQLLFADPDILKEYLAELPEPYCNVLTNTQTKLERTKNNWEFASKLERRGFVTAKQDEQKDVIRIWSKPTAL